MMWRHPREWTVTLLRAWYYLRELVGHPRRLTQDEFARAADTTLLAGSPWVWISPTAASTGTSSVTFAVTNTTWPRSE